MTENQKKLIDLLKKMFQFDQADLDFGIYRIMNLRRDEISKYLNERLIPQISEGISVLANTGNEQEIASVKAQIESTKSLPVADDVKKPMIEALEKKLEGLQSADLSDVEADVYNHLINFFSRYYDEGDFISQRRYKDGVYAIPYEGEEVKLYWANADQYYVKTAEYFTDYTFKTKWGKTVMFKVVDAVVEKDNNKASEKRFFVLHEEKHYEIKDGSLIIYVEYRAAPEFKKQEDASKAIFEALKAEITDTEFLPLFVAPNSKDKSEFERQLFRYTAKNTYDYFIHKDLGKFLRRELDFYIKNEVLFLDDIQIDDMAKTKTYLVKAKVIREAAEKIIDFLAQIEDFQKKMYLKKKMVVDTQYCITLDRIPEEFYPEIAANDAQREEWVKLFAIDEIQADGDLSLFATTIPYSIPLSVEFLKENKHLVVDTINFPEEFKERLIQTIDDIDEKISGLMVKSENFQGLNLFSKKYRASVSGCYIDPPFNLAENADYLYKVNYKDASWLSLLSDRLLLSRKIIKPDGYIFVRCSHDGNMILRMLLDSIFGKENYRNEIILRRAEETKGDLNKQFATIKSITVNYDNLYWYSNSPEARYKKIVKPIVSVQSESHWHSFWKAMDRPTMRYEILGLDLSKHYGQWMWSKERTDIAVKNYIEYIDNFSEKMTIEEYWALTGRSKEFVRRNGDGFTSVQYWIPPREEVMADTNWLDIKGYANKWGFKTENSEGVVERILTNISNEDDVVLDFFMGSGTTAAVALKTGRRFLGFEMGDHFESVLIPRLKAVLNGEQSGVSDKWPYKGGGMIKYCLLESYDDALNNVQLSQNDELLADGLKEDYLLRYMIFSDSNGSVLNPTFFQDPFHASLKITSHQKTEYRRIDFVETFIALIGAKVLRNYSKQNYDASFNRSEDGKLTAVIIKGNKYSFKYVEVRMQNNDLCLLIIRNLTSDIEKDNAVLDAFLEKMIITMDEYDRIYVNGDNNLPNPNGNKVFLIEEEFQRLMFED